MSQKPNSILTPAQVARIKRLLIDGVSRKAIACQFNMSLESIARIHRGETWREVWPESLGATLTPDQKLDAEFLGPAREIETMAERMVEMASKVQVSECPHCRAGVPINPMTGQHVLERYGMEVRCG